MKRIHPILTIQFLSLLLLCIASCADKEDRSPSLADTDRLETLLDRSIPDIASFCEQYGTYVLYDFDQRLDFAYQFEQATVWEKARITRLNHDEAAAAMSWLKEQVFSCYSDEFKSTCLPRKFLITKSIESSDMLGRSEPKSGRHAVVANSNSITVGQYIDAKAIHRAILSDYLVNARGESPVDKAFFEVSQSYYATLMDDRRQIARNILKQNPDFFHDNGFFNPADDESTYFLSSRQDLVQYIDSLIGMDEAMHHRIMNAENTDMMKKMAYVAHGLHDRGVDVASLNPWALDFLEVNISGINPTVRFTSIPAAFTPEETIEFLVLRGENNLQKAEVYLGEQLLQTIDLSQKADAPSIALTANLTSLKPQSNVFSVWVYEAGKVRPSAKVYGTIHYYSADNVLCLAISNDDPNDNTDDFTCENYRLTIDYTDGIVDKRNEKSIITVTFLHKAKLNTKTWEEYDGEKRYWRMHLDGDRVDWIEEYEEVVDYVSYSSSIQYRHTYLFTYDEEGQLTAVTKDDGTTTTTLVSNVAYNQARISRYLLHTGTAMTPYTPQYSAIDGTTRTDLLDQAISGACFQHDGTEESNPFHIAALPAVLPGEVAGVPLHFLYGPVLFQSLAAHDGSMLWSKGWAIDRSDSKNPYIGTTAERQGKTWYYRIILKN